MATISSTKTITSPDGSGFTITTELDTATGKKFTTVNNLQGAFITSGTPEKVSNFMGSITKSSASPGAKALAAETVNVVVDQSETLTAQYQQQVPPPSTEPQHLLNLRHKMQPHKDLQVKTGQMMMAP